MRIELILNHAPNQVLPINYQYLISSWIYRTLENADAAFATWLHERGYMRAGRKYKLFSFGRLEPQRYLINKKDQTFTLVYGPTRLELSFYIDDAMQHFVMGLFQNQRFTLQSGQYFKVDVEVANINLLPKPIFHSTMRFRAVSPICISQDQEGKEYAQYLHPEDEGYIGLLTQNLLRKQQAHQRQLAGMKEEGIHLPMLQVPFRVLSEPRSRLIHIKKTKIRGYVFDFEISAPTNLLEMGYFAGFGEKNSTGFGMVKILK